MRYLLDANVLIYAANEDSAFHQVSREWILDAMKQGTELLLTELTEVALLRLCTHPKLFNMPLEETLGYWLDDLWNYPRTVRVSALSPHNQTFRELVSKLSIVGNDINDAWLAALAIEHKATLVSFDQGFARFPGLPWLDPSPKE
ncbi:TA system VapC family ribonuclease toxin [Haloferula chungangensis]|uniref:Ribonuclease VapC n=1 Tax=Haloferula chungangensis TaxID=1048331 RepID=A0ABW2L5E6_9BACT